MLYVDGWPYNKAGGKELPKSPTAWNGSKGWTFFPLIPGALFVLMLIGAFF